MILDYKMPKKDGLQVAKDILELKPDQRIIFASAYLEEALEDSIKRAEASCGVNAKTIRG